MPILSRRQMLAASSLTLAAPAILKPTVSRADDMAVPPTPSKGEITYLPNFRSKHVSPRDVAIWIPEEEHRKGPLPVIYAGDGEALFDADASKYPSSWNIDLILDMLARQGVGPAIVVANAAVHLERSREYNSPTIARYFDPEMKKVLEQSCGGALLTEQYLDFLTEELKPYVDANFDTSPVRGDTYIMGASMGGMLALEALMSRKEVFSGCIGFSAHLFLFGPGQADYPADGADRLEIAQRQAIAEHFPEPGTTRIYYDRGTVDLDAMYERSHLTIADELVKKGYAHGEDLMTVVQEGASHYDTFWKMRAPDALRFVLG